MPQSLSLAILILGTPLLLVAGTPVDLKLRKSMALLAYLALTEQRHSRDELVELLFPRQGRERGRSDLRHVLWALRDAVGDQIDADRGSVCLAATPELRIDALEFRRVLATAGEAGRAGDMAETERLSTEAVGLVRGELLAGFFLRDSPGFEQWQDGQRECLNREHLSALRRLAELSEARGDLAAATGWVRHRLSIDPLEESGHRDLMRLLALSGERAAAMSQFERYRELLKRELNERPSREIEDLHHVIVAGRLVPARVTSVFLHPSAMLPIQPSSFIGRKNELAALIGLLVRHETRLLTLTGAGGTGKTRLALEAARKAAKRFAHGAVFVDLAPLRLAAEIPAAIALALGFQEVATKGQSLIEVLKHVLAERDLLLVLDNFEHLVSGAMVVAELLAGCPKLVVMATSRAPLRLQVEREMAVGALALPGPAGNAAGMRASDSFRLFEERAAAVRPDFTVSEEDVPAIAEICRRLDGLPLAIELAAAKVRWLTPRMLLGRLDRRLQLLCAGPRDLPARQQSLRAEIAWSHELLEPPARTLFRRLAVFAGGFTLESIEAVCCFRGEPAFDAVGTLGVLVESNLVRRTDDAGQGRLGMLETIREYARERLEECGEMESVCVRAVGFFLTLAETAEPLLFGIDHEEWFRRLDAEYANFLSILGWLRDQGRIEEGLRLAGSLGWYWFRRGRITDGQGWLRDFREASADGESAAARAKAAYGLGWMMVLRGAGLFYDPVAARYFADSLHLFRTIGDARGIALCLAYLGNHDLEGEPIRGCRADLAESVRVARTTRDPWTTAWCLTFAYCWSLWNQPLDISFADRLSAMEEAVALARGTGDAFLLCEALNGMGLVLEYGDDLDGARHRFAEALELARKIHDRWCQMRISSSLGICLAGLGHFEQARTILAEGLRTAVEHGAVGNYPTLIGAFDWAARYEGRMRRAARLWSAAVGFFDPGRSCPRPEVAVDLGLDEETARREWTAGHSMTVEQKIAYALSNDD